MGIKIGTKVVAVKDVGTGFLARKVKAGTAGVVRGKYQEGFETKADSAMGHGNSQRRDPVADRGAPFT